MSRRNPAFGADPYALSAEGLRAGVRRSNANLGEPLASQVRSLIALTDARFAIVPVEVRFVPAPADSGTRAILRVALLDGRLSQITWAGDVATDPAVSPPERGALLAGLASRFADLIAPR
jgi:hypothetical protein